MDLTSSRSLSPPTTIASTTAEQSVNDGWLRAWSAWVGAAPRIRKIDKFSFAKIFIHKRKGHRMTL